MVLYDISLGGGDYPLLHETLSEMETTVVYNVTKLSPNGRHLEFYLTQIWSKI